MSKNLTYEERQEIERENAEFLYNRKGIDLYTADYHCYVQCNCRVLFDEVIQDVSDVSTYKCQGCGTLTYIP